MYNSNSLFLQINGLTTIPSYLHRPIIMDPEAEALQRKIDQLHKSIDELHRHRLRKAHEKMLSSTLATSQKNNMHPSTSMVDINLSTAPLLSHFETESPVFYHHHHWIPNSTPQFVPYLP